MAADNVKPNRLASDSDSAESTHVVRPRDLYQDSCAKIARAIEPDFTYARSKQTCTKNGADLKFEISFQSSHNNVAGKYVALWVHTAIASRKLEAFRQAHACQGCGWTDKLVVGQIGNLLPKPKWHDWNLAVCADDVINEVVATIQSIAIPFFRIFENIDALAARLCGGEIPSLRVENAIQFLLAYGRSQEALEHGRWYLRQNPSHVPCYRDFLASYQGLGLPAKPDATSYAAGLAKIAILHAMEFD